MHLILAIQVFHVCATPATPANLIASVDAVDTFLGLHLTFEDSFLVYPPPAHEVENII